MSLDKPLPDEVADVMYALLRASMGRGVGDPGDMTELLVAAACAYADAERQTYMRGMLDVLKQQNRARRQTGGIGPSVTGQLPPGTARASAGEPEEFLDAPSGDDGGLSNAVMAQAQLARATPTSPLRRRHS